MAPSKTRAAIIDQYHAAFAALADQATDLAADVEQQADCLAWAKANDCVTPECFKPGELDAVVAQLRALLPTLERFANSLQSGKHFQR